VRLSLWINAFIPKNVEGNCIVNALMMTPKADYTILIKRGQNQGRTAIPLPALAYLPNLPAAILNKGNVGFLTDQRGFSNDITASVRMQSAAHLDIYPMRVVLKETNTSGTREVNTDTGETLHESMADLKQCRVYDPYITVPPEKYPSKLSRYQHPVGADTGAPFRETVDQRKILSSINRGDSYAYSIDMHGEASDPLVRVAANIDYDITFYVDIDFASRGIWVSVEGFVDAFPAFECYVKYNGITKTLFQLAPPKGNTVVNLLGYANRLVAGSLFIPGLI
jgi:hypothetical protein